MTFHYLQLELTFTANGLLKLPEFAGSMLRGAFGASLKRMFCVNSAGCGKHCEHPDRCTYGKLFETPLSSPHDQLGDVKFAPHPFALYCQTLGPRLLEPGQDLTMVWTLWGNALPDISYYLLAWKQAAQRGFGADRTSATLKAVVRTDSGAVVMDPHSPRFGDLSPCQFTTLDSDSRYTVALKTLSPLRLKYNRSLFGKSAVGELELPSEVLRLALLRRLSTCLGISFNDSGALATQPWVSENSCFRWKEHKRYSNRQKISMQMGGLEGRIVWRDLPVQYLNLLRAGEILQIGKGTSMGLGKYQLEVQKL